MLRERDVDVPLVLVGVEVNQSVVVRYHLAQRAKFLHRRGGLFVVLLMLLRLVDTEAVDFGRGCRGHFLFVLDCGLDGRPREVNFAERHIGLDTVAARSPIGEPLLEFRGAQVAARGIVTLPARAKVLVRLLPMSSPPIIDHLRIGHSLHESIPFAS